MRARPWWLWIATASFISYWLFLNSTLYYAREPVGYNTTIQGGGMFVRDVAPGFAAERAGVQAGDRVVSLEGLEIEDRIDATTMQAAHPIGAPVDMVVERGGRRLTLTIEPLFRRWVSLSPVWVAITLSLLTSLVLGLLLAWRGDGRPLTLLAAWLLCAIGCASLPIFPRSMGQMWRALPAPIEVLVWPAALSSIIAPALMFAFCALVPSPVMPRGWLVAALAPISLVTGYVAVSALLVIYDPARATRMPIPAWFQRAGPLSYGVYFAAGAAMLIVSLRRVTDVTERRRLQTLLAGTIFGGAGLLVIGSIFVVTIERFQLVQATGAALFSVLPITFAYATLRHRLFDLRVIVRIGLQYALARGLILAIIPVAVAALVADVALHGDQPVRAILADRGWSYAAVAAIVGVIYVKRDDWMRALDRRFFRERYAAQQILKDVVEDIGRSSDFDTAARKVVARVHSALHPAMAAVMKRPRSSTTFTAAAKLPEAAPLAALLTGNAITQVVRALGRPVVFGTQGLRDIPVDQQQWLTQSNVEVVVPIVAAASRDEAVLVLGPRRSEEPYAREDLELLAAIGTSLGLLIGRDQDAGLAETVAHPGGAPPLKIGGRYRIERPIGEGGMGVVYAAVDETLERAVAIKVIKDRHLLGDDGLARFTREARTAASLSHPHIVTVHDFGVDDNGAPYLVMELLEGQSLRAALKTEGRMAADRALPLLAGLASAVDAAHAKGVVHRDLKPENVFLAGKTTHAKILDYGIAKAASASGTFATPGVLGTLAYMAPEQAAGQEAKPAWDVWALSVIAFELLTGAHPFGGGLAVAAATPARAPAPDLDDALAAALDRALSLNPDLRPANADALMRSLQSGR